MEEKNEYQNLFSPLNASIPLGMTPYTESLKSTYDRVVPFYENEIKKNLLKNNNIFQFLNYHQIQLIADYLLVFLIHLFLYPKY